MSSKKPQVSCAYYTDTMIVTKVNYMFYPHKILSFHFVKQFNRISESVYCSSEQTLNNCFNNHRSWGVRSVKAVQQHLFLFDMCQETVPAVCNLDATQVLSRLESEEREKLRISDEANKPLSQLSATNPSSARCISTTSSLPHQGKALKLLRMT